MRRRGTEGRRIRIKRRGSAQGEEVGTDGKKVRKCKNKERGRKKEKKNEGRRIRIETWREIGRKKEEMK